MAGGRLLLVEDDSLVRSALSTFLKDSGFAVETASSGEEGVRRLTGGPFDAVVIDLRLGGEMDGIGVLRRLRESQPDAAAVMVTGYGSLETAREAIRMGAVDYLLKPLVPEQLLQTLRGAIRRGGPGGPRRRVLVVSGEEPLREQLLDALKSGGAAARGAPSLAEGLRMLERERYDAVVADLHLPDGEGTALCHPARPAILLGEPPDLPSAVRALRSGAYEFLPRPAEPGRILQAVEGSIRHMEGREPAPGRTYLVKEKGTSRGLDLLRRALQQGMAGLLIGREAIPDAPPPAAPVLRLTTVDPGAMGPSIGKGGLRHAALTPADPTRGAPARGDVVSTVLSFLQEHREQGAAVLIEGLEYLKTLHGLDPLLGALYQMEEAAEASGGVLLLQVDPEAWLPREMALLERGTRVVSPQERELKGDELQVMDALRSQGPLYQTDLADALGFPKAKMSRLLDRLEAAGMVERRRAGMSNLVVPR